MKRIAQLLAFIACLFTFTPALAGTPVIPPSPPIPASATQVQTAYVIHPFGDSFTQGGQDSTTQFWTSWPQQLELVSGYNVTNGILGGAIGGPPTGIAGVGGIGGQTSTQIAERQGGLGFTVTFSGSALNTGSNTITNINGATITNATGPISNPSNNSNYNLYGTVCGQHGVILRTASGGPPSTTETYTFTPDATLSSFACAANSAFTVDNLALASQPQIIEACRNDILVSLATCEANVDAMIAAITATGNQNYMILTVPNQEGEPSGSASYITIQSGYNYFNTKYPGHVVDWRAYMVSQYNPNNAGDVLDFNNDIPPLSLRAQNVSSTLTTSIADASTCTFSTAAALASPGTIITVGTEKIYIQTASGSNVTACTRGYASTTAVSHTNGTAFTGVDRLHWSAAGYTLAAKYINANLGVLKPTNSAVMTPANLPSSQTLNSIVFPKLTAGGLTLFNISALNQVYVRGSAAGPPIFAFRNQAGNGSGQLSVTADGNTMILSGNGANISGVTTNSNAAAGNVGEVISSTVASGSAVSLTSATPANITSISLTAGDWNCWAVADYTLTGATASDFKAGISATSATFGAQDSFTELPIITTLLSGNMTSPTPTNRLALASTTTEYLVGQETFSAGSVSAYGTLTCRRMR